MSECLMAQRGGKYTRGRTITDYNISVVHNLFDRIDSSNLFRGSYLGCGFDKSGYIYLAMSDYTLKKISCIDYSVIWSVYHATLFDVLPGRHIVIDDAGDIYLIDFHHDIVKVSGEDGSIIWNVYITNSVCDITIGNSGFIYVVDSSVHKLQAIDGSEIWSVLPATYNYNCIVADTMGNICVTYSYYNDNTHVVPNVFKISGVNGSLIWNVCIEWYARYVSVDLNNDFYVLVGNGAPLKIYKFSGIDGSQIWENTSGIYTSTVSDEGYVYTNDGNTHLKRISLDGSTSLTSTDGFQYNVKCLILYKDFIIIINEYDGNVQIFRDYRKIFYKIIS